MAKQLTLELSKEQRRELEAMRDRHAQPYMRERAAAVLKIADGASGRSVASGGLLRRRRRETVGRWVSRYRERGVDGLKILPGRGRKPAFSPSASERRPGQAGTRRAA
jgi:transposase